MARWKQFDQEWSRPMRMRLFFTTGDLIFRERDDPIIARNVAEWTKLKVPFEQPSVEDVAKEYPVIDLRRITKVLLEPDAGVVRARRACEVVAEACAQSGGEVVIGTARLGAHRDGRLQSIDLEAPEGTRRGETFVFALGPWFPKFFPQLMGPRIRTPMGLVHYFGTPPHDDRFTFPNMPSWNFPGATGWPALPVDNRGFRARLTGERLYDPDTSQRAFARGKDKEPRQLLKERFPLLHKMPLLETRACHYELSTSRNFIIDRHPDFSNVWIAGGGSAEGFKFGPVVGEYVARRVLGEPGDPMLAEAFGLPMSEPEPQPGR
jgi:glycine/D-amino acid oxidase-like deaminating enzyme